MHSVKFISLLGEHTHMWELTFLVYGVSSVHSVNVSEINYDVVIDCRRPCSL